MRNLTGLEIRSSFIRFFEEKSHRHLPSASLIPQDPQLLFTVAGMVPFKPIFWGKQTAPFPRIVTCQKCVRTVDIDQVGRTPRHHTFFEMLGNFSFGDYFKKETILWAWEYVTQVLEIPQDRLSVTIYLDDDEADEIWRQEVGLSSSKITRMGKKDNFWGPAGPSGPCGPDSEIFFDMGTGKDCPDPDHCSPACDCGRFLEIWNLVFTGLNQDEEGNLTSLPKKNIDTGAGLDRIASVLQQVSSNYETDLFLPIIDKAQSIMEKRYGHSDQVDTALRVIADHIRSSTFMITDGILPSNEGRGYVLKRIIRRALRFGWILGIQRPFLHQLVPSVVEVMKASYPELTEKEGFVCRLIENEEERFLSTMSDGLIMIEELFRSRTSLSPADIFKLYDTFGFPVEVVDEILREKGQQMDWQGFQELMEQQKTQARAARGDRAYLDSAELYDEAAQRHGSTDFLGYEALACDSHVLEIFVDGQPVGRLEEGQSGEVIVEATTFYPERGGQVADTGTISGPDFEGQVIHVFIPCHDLIVHQIKNLKGRISKGDLATLAVDASLRKAIQSNHTATHLLHAALRDLLGTHVQQSGSWVGPKRLRFDFSHFQAISPEQIRQLETVVNQSIMKAEAVKTLEMDFNSAKDSGAIGLFEEKYGANVRVVEAGSASQELCGGTHVRNTGEIGSFRILSESAVSSGIRRIEAITGWAVLERMDEIQTLISQASDMMQVEPNYLPRRCREVMQLQQEMNRKIISMQQKISFMEIPQHVASGFDVNGIRVVPVVASELDPRVLREISDRIISVAQSGVAIVIHTEGSDKVQIAVKVSPDLVSKKIHAGQIAKALAQFLDGNGGGKPDFAQAGGKSPGKVAELKKALPELLATLWNS